jgi:dolichol-phosphate mannosyltransferase
MSRTLEMRMSTLRLYSAYGPYEEPTRLIPKLVTLGLGKKFPPLANPDIARDFVYIDDVCDAFMAAATNETEERGAVYNVGSGKQTTLKEIVDLVQRVLGIDSEPEWGSMQARAWDTSVWVSDSRKIRNVLGWEATTGLEEGLSRFARWFRDNPEMLRRYREMAA